MITATNNDCVSKCPPEGHYEECELASDPAAPLEYGGAFYNVRAVLMGILPAWHVPEDVIDIAADRIAALAPPEWDSGWRNEPEPADAPLREAAQAVVDTFDAGYAMHVSPSFGRAVAALRAALAPKEADR